MDNEVLTKELATIKSQISKAETAANGLQIKVQEDMPAAVELLSKIKIVGKMITQKKESITKPLNEALKNARSFFSPVESDYIRAEKIVKDKMSDFQEAELEKAAKKAEAIEAKVAAGKITEEKAEQKIEAIAIPVAKVEAKSGVVRFRTDKEVIIDDETKIPREYLVLDMVKIRKASLAGVKIPGVSVIEKQTVVNTI